MKYTITTNIPFGLASIFADKYGIVVSPYSYKLRNLGHNRWKLKYKNKQFYKTNPEVGRIMRGNFGDSNPKKVITFTRNGKLYKLTGVLRNMVYHTDDNLKNNQAKKHYLIFYIDPSNKKINMSFKQVKKLNISFLNRVLSGPRFQYGYCHYNRWKPCNVLDYLGKTKYFQGHIQDISFCKPFDHHKGPFNPYCVNTN